MECKCEECGKALLQPETIVIDFPDASYYGHGQYEKEVLMCPLCEAVYELVENQFQNYILIQY